MPNKKISQLVNKTTILSTDLFPIGDATSGQLYKKTIAELQAAIGGAVISVNGLVGTVVLDTDDIQELASPTNKYFTDARARAALSATSPLAFNSSTGVFSMPAATTSANGYLTSTDWNTFNGKENVLTFSSPLVRTSNTISMPVATTSVNGYLSSTDWNTFNNKQGALSLTTTGSSGASTLIGNTLNVPTYTLAGLGGITASFLSGGTGITYNSGTGVIATTITQYTDALARASLSFTAGSGAYNSTTGVITIPTNTSQLTNGASFITLGSLSGGTGITYNSTTGAISYSGTVYTDASIRGLFSGSTGISYNSTTGAISSTITQYTDALARGAISLTTSGTSGASTYNSTTGVLNIPNYGSALSGYLPLTGGTLTGALAGTSASFSSTIQAGGRVNIQGTNQNTIWLNQNAGGTSTGYLIGRSLGSTDTQDFFIYDVAASLTRLTIASTGAATFSSSVTASTLNLNTTVSTGAKLIVNGYTDFWSATNTLLRVQHNGTIATLQSYTGGANGVIALNPEGGNILVGTTTDSGYKLDVNGAARVNNLLWFTPSAGLMAIGASGTNFQIYNGSGAETRLTIDASGNLGLGVTPSAWSGNWKAIQLNGGSIFNYLTSEIHLGQNFYYSTSSIANYQNNGFASDYWQYNGQHIWMTAPSGTAGNAITFTQAMTLDASGRLGIGTSSPTTKVDISYADNNYAGGLTITNTTNGSQAQSKINIVNSAGTILSLMSQSPSVNSGVSFITTSDTTPLVFGTAYIEKIRITNNGNLLVGTSTDSGYKLDVNGTGRFSGNLQVNGFIYTPSASSSANLSGFVSQYSGNASSRSWKITNDVVEYGDYAIQQSTTQTGTTYASKLYFNAAGAATFSSSVTATQATFTATANTYAGGALILKAFGGTNPIYLTSVSGYFALSNGGGADHLLISSTGASTFSSSVDINSYIRNTNSSSNSAVTIAADGTSHYIQATNAARTVYNNLLLNPYGGNIGVGTASPAQKFEVSGGAIIASGFGNRASGTGKALEIGMDGTQGLLQAIDRTASALIPLYFSSSAATFSSSVTAGGGALITGSINSTSGNYWEIKTDTNGYYILAINRADSNYNKPAYIDAKTLIINNGSSGNILLGTATDNGERLYVSGNIRATGTITANSDIRLKKNLERIENALEKVGQISGYTYNTIYDDKRHGGVIAQEIDEVFPEIVNKGNDGLLGVEYGNISALLIEALKEATTKIKALESKVEALQK